MKLARVLEEINGYTLDWDTTWVHDLFHTTHGKWVIGSHSQLLATQKKYNNQYPMKEVATSTNQPLLVDYVPSLLMGLDNLNLTPAEMQVRQTRN